MILVAGASSGLGKYLAGALKARAYDRAAGKPSGRVPATGYDAVIHCAFGMPAKDQSEADYLKANLALAETLLALPHRRFVFISSVDVLKPESGQNAYSRAKAAIEKLVLAKAANPLVLRPGALLGPGMRPSQLLRVARGERGPFTLSAESTFAPVLYADVLAAIQAPAADKTLVVSGRTLTLGVVSRKAGTAPAFGTFRYETPSTAKQKVAAVPALAEDPVVRVMDFVKREGWL